MKKSHGLQRVRLGLALSLAAMFCFVLPLRAREQSDVIIMKNGDKITCEIKSLSSNTLYISVGYILNTLSVDWTKVDHLESRQLFLVKTQDGAVYQGVLTLPKTQDKRPVQIEIVEAPEKRVSLERAQVIDVSQTSANIWQRFNGEFGLGATYTKGNQSTQYNLNTQIAYEEERWSAGASYTSNLNSSSGVSISTRNDLTLTGRRMARWKNWYYTGVGDFLQSSAQGIKLQSTFGGGIGRDIKNTGGTHFTVYGGFAWQTIDYHQEIIQAATQHVTSALVGTGLEMFRFDRTTLKASVNLLPALSEPGRLHVTIDSTYYVKIWGKLDWNITFYGNWDNRPPPGFSGSDYGTSTGLSVSFGNR